MIRRFLICAALVAATLGPATSAFAQTAPPSGSIGIGLLEAPVSREGDPRARTYIVDHLAQGATIQRKIEVSNGTNTTQAIQLYSGAATIGGGEFVAVEGRGGNDLAGWTAVDPAQVTVRPGQRATATVTIAVPRQAGDGERYGVVWAGLVPAPNASGVTVLNRVGIRVYLSVGTGTEPASDFTIESLTAKRLTNGQPAVSAVVRNTGGRALDMSGSLELHNGPGGLSAGPFAAELGTTLGLGQREPVLVKLDPRIPRGPWDAVISLKSGVIQHSARATITFPAGAGTSSRPVKASSLEGRRRILLPLAGVVLALVVALLLVLRRRRKEDKYAEIEADLRRFERLLRAQRDGTEALTAGDDPAVAIRAAIKQAGRAGDGTTAARLQAKLDELLDLRSGVAPSGPSGADDGGARNGGERSVKQRV